MLIARSKSIAIILLLLSFLVLLNVWGERETREWPESGKRKIMAMVEPKNNRSLDCYPSQWVKQNEDKIGKLKNLMYLGTTMTCPLDTENIIWNVYEETVNATLRCEKRGVVGEYTITVFKTYNPRYGDYMCNSAHFANSEEYELGSVTDIMEAPF